MKKLTFKKNKSNYEVIVFENQQSKSSYNNKIDNDPRRIAQILIDLEFMGFPILKAIKIMEDRLKNKDWFGF